MPGAVDYFSTHTVTARRAHLCDCCRYFINPKDKYVRVSGGSAGQHWTKAYHTDCHAQIFPAEPMTFETAEKINSAAVAIGLCLVGAQDLVAPETVALIRAVSLAQIETAKDQIEAANREVTAGGKGGKIRVVCADELVANVKRYADSARLKN